MSKSHDTFPSSANVMTIGDIIRLALEYRAELKPNQKSVESVASLLNVDPRTVMRWRDDENVPDLRQFTQILQCCVFPQGFDLLKDLAFPALK